MITPIRLSGKFVDLEPIELSHREELRAISQDDSIWHYATSGKDFDRWFEKALESDTQCAFIVRRKDDGKLVGSTRYYDIELKHRRLMIGYTWYISEARGSMINPETKLLLLSYAFESQNINRITFMIDSRNLRSIAAVKKLGAKQEGILREHMILEDGYIRDSIVLSILQSEWAEIKQVLGERLDKITS